MLEENYISGAHLLQLIHVINFNMEMITNCYALRNKCLRTALLSTCVIINRWENYIDYSIICKSAYNVKAAVQMD